MRPIKRRNIYERTHDEIIKFIEEHDYELEHPPYGKRYTFPWMLEQYINFLKKGGKI